VLEYVSILDGHDKVPFILDANDVVCSLPPIINGEHSKMSRHTKNVYVLLAQLLDRVSVCPLR